MSSSPGIKIAAAASVALIIFLYARSGHQPTGENQDQVAGSSVSPERQQVEQRLEQLRAAHDRTSRERQSVSGDTTMSGRKIEARSAVSNPIRISPPRPAAPAASAQEDSAGGDDDIDPDPDDIPALKNIATRDADPERRLAAVTMLGASDDPSVVPALAQALSDEDDEVRMAAIQSLADFTGDAPVDLLSKVVVDDPSADNRYEALEALSDLGGDRATGAIQKALNDPDEDVRALAEGILDNEDTFQDSGQNTDTAATPAVQPTPSQ